MIVSKEKQVRLIRKKLNHTLQTIPRHPEEGPHNYNNHRTSERQTNLRNQLYLPHQDDCKTKMTQSNAQQNIEQVQIYTKRAIINNKSTISELLP